MKSDAADLLTPRILVVDDERQIHASLRLRLGRDYDLVFCFDARDALEKLQHQRFDLCFADIHMPQMDGLTFIDTARQKDPALGYVVLSAFDTDDNLRRAIPLQVFDFLSKPLPEKHEFEARLPGWIDRTRQQRREQSLARQSDTIAHERSAALLDREVELVAAETARDALLQTANLLTTVHAHLVSATNLLGSGGKSDPRSGHLARNLEEARKTAEAAMTVAAGFFDSGYGSRHSSSAVLNEGVRHAIGIATRMNRTEEANTAVDFNPAPGSLALEGLTGMEFLLMLVPALGLALACTPPNTTIGLQTEQFARMETVIRDPRRRSYLWVNRRNALGSRAGVVLTIGASAPPLDPPEVEAWLRGESGRFPLLSSRGLSSGIQKCRGAIAFSVAPHADQFRLALVLPA